jgi:voltage-gated potassium channel
VKAPRLNWQDDPAHPISQERRERYERFSDAMELPLVILSVVMIPLILLPLISDLPDDVDLAFFAADVVIWVVFAFDYFVKLALAPQRWFFVKHNVLELIVVIVPFLRPLRALRILRLAAFVGIGSQKSRHSTHVRGVGYVVVITLALVIVLSAVVYEMEHDAAGANIKTWPDSLWWAASTASTVGYGDRVPVTAGGRISALLLMISGIALLGVITASLATFFVSHSRGEKEEEEEQFEAVEDERHRQILDRLTAIESSIAKLQRETAGPAPLPSELTDGANRTFS